MNYICQKNLTLFGTAYQPGDIIPEEAVLGSRVRSLMTCGYIMEQPDDAPSDVAVLASADETAENDMVLVPIQQGASDELVVPISKDDAALIFCLMQENAEKAIWEINEINDENVLIVIHATDGRKSVKNAAKERASTLHTTNGENADSTASQWPITSDNE